MIEVLDERKKFQNDLVLVTGDFNISSLPLNKISAEKFIKFCPKFAKAIEDLNMEYTIFMDIISSGKKHIIKDLLKIDNGGESQVTYADTCINEEGKEVPFEQILTVEEENTMKLCLDYIIEFIRGDENF